MGLVSLIAQNGQLFRDAAVAVTVYPLLSDKLPEIHCLTLFEICVWMGVQCDIYKLLIS
jgi:hypothetical protein